LIGFCWWKFKQITKIGFGRQNQWRPQFVHIMQIKKFSILKMRKIKNVVTLGPMAWLQIVEGYSNFFGVGIFLIARFG
jgi:hypothetical protein